MGRRSVHTSEELRELILEATTEIVTQSGYSAVSAREIARRINYSPGTLYNVFDNLDDLVLTIEGRLLDRLLIALDEVPETATPSERVHKFADCYLKFTCDNPKLWNLLLEHHLPPNQSVPVWYQQKLELLLGRVEDVLDPVLRGAETAALRRSARVLWASVHGITSLATTEKLSSISTDTAASMLHDLVTRYLAGVETIREHEGSPAIAS
ncbi:MAG: TetR/AcrR family transcriptional regulator [Hyphomicrobium sp.]